MRNGVSEGERMRNGVSEGERMRNGVSEGERMRNVSINIQGEDKVFP